MEKSRDGLPAYVSPGFWISGIAPQSTLDTFAALAPLTSPMPSEAVPPAAPQWSRCRLPSQWAIVFDVEHHRTIARRFKDDPRFRKVTSRQWQFRIDALPATYDDTQVRFVKWTGSGQSLPGKGPRKT
ncbi:hypothetical protein Pan44_49620 [Caulifigura coniformis]|uniref:Uncharacterized protein n=1 Tax=Caulifigura coniformis TaxID=2527983 RepID=A0A517SLA1_9PLAN|nr:hypothetical protein Pan44_49620 [Caulifigura coniformis]